MTQEEADIIFKALFNLSFCIGYMQAEQPDKCKEYEINLQAAVEKLFEIRKRL